MNYRNQTMDVSRFYFWLSLLPILILIFYYPRRGDIRGHYPLLLGSIPNNVVEHDLNFISVILIGRSDSQEEKAKSIVIK